MPKRLFLVLLVAVLGITEGREDELWCYRCEHERSHVNCEKLQKCAERDSHCFTTVARGESGEDLLYKGCSPRCAKYPVIVASPLPNSTQCCHTSFCNRSGAANMKSSHVAVGVGILASVLYILQS
uniref:lymphocyte antigen 6E-like n=1 Tax=Euleptes europaea TaxID=460621 RepID=UPI00254079C0|nr:lymphocyte antigen 6E-like [Euleptes europaea]